MARIYSSHPDVDPVGGRKSLGGRTSPVWYQHVVVDGFPFVGPDIEAVRAFFFDSATIESLGRGAIINVPVRDAGQTIGPINLLDREGAYNADSVDPALRIASLLVDTVRAAALTI